MPSVPIVVIPRLSVVVIRMIWVSRKSVTKNVTTCHGVRGCSGGDIGVGLAKIGTGCVLEFSRFDEVLRFVGLSCG